MVDGSQQKHFIFVCCKKNSWAKINGFSSIFSNPYEGFANFL